jgi:ubiquinol-cytochrome c reductase iron-sulfur subunit
MSDNDADLENAPEQRRPHRVIGTPPPTAGMLTDPGQRGESGGRGGTDPDSPGEAEAPELHELPADPPDPVSARNWERVAALLFTLSALASVGFIAAYVGLEIGTKNGDVVDATLRSNLALGTAMSVAFLAIGVGMVIWVRYIMPPVEMTEERHSLASDPADRAAFAETFIEGAETSQITKRPLLRRTLLTALLPVAAAPLIVLRDLGPLPGTSLRHTVWKKGMRLTVYGSNKPITPADFDSPGGMITVIPAGFQDNDEVLAKATVIIIKMEPGQLKAPTNLNWTVDNIVAYSKICTHVGCPAALYEQTTHKILCPCHQSTFDATRGATVLFGPAPRPLPQLPITVDAQGYLVAQSDFHEPIGPSFWERG